jgi:hypothetical protein
MVLVTGGKRMPQCNRRPFRRLLGFSLRHFKVVLLRVAPYLRLRAERHLVRDERPPPPVDDVQSQKLLVLRVRPPTRPRAGLLSFDLVPLLQRHAGVSYPGPALHGRPPVAQVLLEARAERM